MLSADDAEKLTVPLAMYISKDEPIAEVNTSISPYPRLISHNDQYNTMKDIIAKKPFASKNDCKNYENMYVSSFSGIFCGYVNISYCAGSMALQPPARM